MIKNLVSPLLSLFVVVAGGCLTIEAGGTNEKWRKDLRDLERQLIERHVDLFHSVSREEFEKAVENLDRRIPALAPPQILTGIAQLVAMIGDGHTSFYPGDQKKWRFRYYPLRLWSFSDGMYAIATTEEHSHVFGKRLLRIDDTPVDEAFRAISTTIGADNEMEHRYSVPFELVRPELLYALGLTRSPDQAEFVFDDDVRVTFRPITMKQSRGLEWVSVNGMYDDEVKLPSARLEFLFATPLTLEHLQQRRYYWFTYLEEDQALFFQYNTCWNQKDRPTFAEITQELFDFLEHHPVRRVIVDLRQNTGGEPLVAQPLIDGLAQRTELGAEGRLFVLVGRRTYSAALTNAAQLRRRAGARVVGEPPRGRPNHPSEGRDIELKRTKLRASVSTQFVERDPALGDARHLPVDIDAAYSFRSYRDARDPVLQAALDAEIGKGHEATAAGR